MATKPPKADIDETQVRVTKPKKTAVGVPAVLHALQMSQQQMGVLRSVQTLTRVNQKDGFDCPGCAWPEADKRHVAEFCENGAKAVAEEPRSDGSVRSSSPPTRSRSSAPTTTGGSASRGA